MKKIECDINSIKNFLSKDDLERLNTTRSNMNLCGSKEKLIEKNIKNDLGTEARKKLLKLPEMSFRMLIKDVMNEIMRRKGNKYDINNKMNEKFEKLSEKKFINLLIDIICISQIRDNKNPSNRSEKSGDEIKNFTNDKHTNIENSPYEENTKLQYISGESNSSSQSYDTSVEENTKVQCISGESNSSSQSYDTSVEENTKVQYISGESNSSSQSYDTSVEENTKEKKYNTFINKDISLIKDQTNSLDNPNTLRILSNSGCSNSLEDNSIEDKMDISPIKENENGNKFDISFINSIKDMNIYQKITEYIKYVDMGQDSGDIKNEESLSSYMLKNIQLKQEYDSERFFECLFTPRYFLDRIGNYFKKFYILNGMKKNEEYNEIIKKISRYSNEENSNEVYNRELNDVMKDSIIFFINSIDFEMESYVNVFCKILEEMDECLYIKDNGEDSENSNEKIDRIIIKSKNLLALLKNQKIISSAQGDISNSENIIKVPIFDDATFESKSKKLNEIKKEDSLEYKASTVIDLANTIYSKINNNTQNTIPTKI